MTVFMVFVETLKRFQVIRVPCNEDS